MSWMKDLMAKLSNGAQLVLKRHEGMFLVTNVCMMLPKSRRGVGCNTDAVCFTASLVFVVETFTRQVLNEDSNVKRSVAAADAAWRYVSEMDGVQMSRKS